MSNLICLDLLLKFKVLLQLLTLMSFQTRKTFVHLRNANEDLFNEI